MDKDLVSVVVASKHQPETSFEEREEDRILSLQEKQEEDW